MTADTPQARFLERARPLVAEAAALLPDAERMVAEALSSFMGAPKEKQGALWAELHAARQYCDALRALAETDLPPP